MSVLRPVTPLLNIPDRVSRFRELSQLYCDYLKSEGKSVRPFKSAELPIFAALPEPLQDRAIASTVVDLEIFEAMHQEGYSLKDSPKLLWRSMRRLGLMPAGDAFDKIADEDTVEIYLVQAEGQHQIFRNLTFFDYVSFTYEQMAALDWRLSVTRDPKYLEQLGAAAMEIMSGRRTETFDPGVEPHVGRELNSEGLFAVEVAVKHLSPVKSQGQTVGVLVIEKLKIVGVGRPEYARI